MNPSHARLFNAALALLAWFALLLQLNLSVGITAAAGQPAVMGLVAYLGYFTVLTNFFVALVLSCPFLLPDSAAGRFFAKPQVRGCAVTSIAMVGITYHLLLRHVWSPQGAQWLADMLLHYAMPIGFFLYWCFALPLTRLAWSAPFGWSVYPLAYLAYALVRGEFLGRYPYPFIDVTALGYGQSLVNALGLLVAFVLLGWLMVAISNARARRHARQ
jgi:hypothetical protein